MDEIIKKCDKCGDIAIYAPEHNIHQEGNCNGNLIKVNLSYEDFIILCDISEDNDFFQAMIDLKDRDIIEYNLKLSQFKSQLEQQKSNRTQNDTTPSCPNCKSTNIKPISALNRGASIAVLGVFSKKINKSYECKNCGYTW